MDASEPATHDEALERIAELEQELEALDALVLLRERAATDARGRHALADVANELGVEAPSDLRAWARGGSSRRSCVVGEGHPALWTSATARPVARSSSAARMLVTEPEPSDPDPACEVADGRDDEDEQERVVVKEAHEPRELIAALPVSQGCSNRVCSFQSEPLTR